MPTRRYLQLDVFADRPGAGNPLAVIVDADGLDAAAMQSIAAWTNLSETIFLLPPTDAADYRVRIFTPRQELPFAGHPSVGAAWAALDQALATPTGDRLVQQCAAGLLPVRIAGDAAHRTTSVRAPRGVERSAPGSASPLRAQVLAGFGASEAPCALIDNGPRWWCIALTDEAAVRDARPPLDAIAAWCLATGAVGVAIFAPTGDTALPLVVRAFCPADGIPEDPVTGSANAAIGAWLAATGGLDAIGPRYVASQGREVGRDGRVTVEVDAEGEVWNGGTVQAVVRGRFDW
ncbi:MULTISPECIES: PhzF family phenazine biosynthesis protein [Luteimonas]|uniref:PhzF family phenazine biosynthesis protein n=1 Tax=Luteimonas TaxID=83614 RepID=UPI000C7BA35E|nr:MULTISPECIES: PhzF family phenazine biosynthesis protein [Luteimonas]